MLGVQRAGPRRAAMRTIVVWIRRCRPRWRRSSGRIVAGGAVLAWHISDRQQSQRSARRGAARPGRAWPPCCAVLRSSAVVVDRATTSSRPPRRPTPSGWCAAARSLVDDLLDLIAQVRRDGQIRETEHDMPAATAATARTVVARVAPLGSRLVLALVEDRTRETSGRVRAPRLRRQRQPRAQDPGRCDPAARRGRHRRLRRPRGRPALRQPDADRERPALQARPADHRAVPPPGRRPARDAGPGASSTTWSPPPSTPAASTPAPRTSPSVTTRRPRASRCSAPSTRSAPR